MENFTWIKIYNKIGRKILEYTPSGLAELMYEMLKEANVDMGDNAGPNMDSDGVSRIRYTEIDPISFMNRFNLYSREKANRLIEAFEKLTGLPIEIPSDTDGIPSTNPFNSCVIMFKYERGENDIKDIWELFEYVMNEKDKIDEEKFIFLYDRVISKKFANNNISIGLFKVRPDLFIGLDSTNRNYFKNVIGIKLKSTVFGKDYLDVISKVKEYMKDNNINSFAELSHKAWEISKNEIETKMDYSVLDELVEEYKENFEDNREDELYKWEAIKTFQDNWNIDDANFVEMMRKSFSKSANLLTSFKYFPYGAIIEFAEKEEETVREMFRVLFDESKQLIDRGQFFIDKSDELLNKYSEKGKNHFQDAHAISVYLSFMYPEKYYIYKSSIDKPISKELKRDISDRNKMAELEKFFDLCDELLEYIQKDNELIKMSRDSLNQECYKDENNHLLVADLLYYYGKRNKNADNNKSNNSRIWLFAPGEGAKLWDECYNNNLMLIGWDKVGDIAGFKNKSQINDALKDAYKDNGSMRNDTNTLYQFANEVKVGDIVIAKKGNHVLLGYGKVTSDYYYIDDREEYKKARNVEWLKKGVWDISDKDIGNLNIKTLTDLSPYGDYGRKLLEIMDGEEIMDNKKSNSGRKYYWLNANPKNWSFDRIKVGECIDYTSTNENGNKRRIYRNFLEIKKGDLIIGYEATPRKRIVALCEAQDRVDNDKFWVKKTENLINPIPLDEIKNLEYFSKSEFSINPQGSLFKLTEDEYNELMDVIRDYNPKEVQGNKEKYTEEEFNRDVLMKNDTDLYNELKTLLERKGNIILQGAPGVGKTYIAKRLAWALTGEIDSNRIKFVQFHQSYGYEDFITGFKPNDNGGFDKEDGIFYEFCKMAENDTDPDHKYVFIIDEINRGNVSKIFGETLMLIERDKRGQQASLAYKKDEKFSVPENVYIIGMMNTADRSIAMLDYALRRRFAFYTLDSLYGTEELKQYVNKENDPKLNVIMDIMADINKRIREDESLGEEFEIGHSYFCNLKNITDDELRLIVEYEILPLLKEYYFDNIEEYNKCKNELLGVF